MNVAELLEDLRDQHDQSTARADDLRRQIERLATELTEAEARLIELDTTRKIVQEITRTSAEPTPPEPSTAYQDILNAFNQHPDQAFRVRDLHEHLGMPTDDPAMNVTRSRLGRLVRQGFLTQPGRGLCQKQA
ncbi:hypothetical protein GCM10010193_08210 [Kitasatospora atroaurantiaca]|uniref:Uncharacterized protein n=1 Tax=Kitasatospora atroaurantiaca TaxID=285545 RepID=A0A561EJI3_9ACTN|nr:hypothetical protein [Kitasatospora atroaurantiaca]TWE15775.1 hypothetical protein FB465_0711 [Kitasatospora atroaurantiaca]